KFLAPTDRGGILLSSDDGVSWVTHDTTYANSLNDVAYGNGLYCVATAGSGPVYFSSDLENWDMVSSSVLPSNSDNVYFANGLFFFGGAHFGNSPGIVTTADGITFNNPTTPGQHTIRDIIFANDLYVTVGDGLEIMTSPDGITWTLRPTGAPIEGLGEGLLNIRYFNGLFVVGGKQNTILTSPDGITWTHQPFTEDSSWFFDSWYNGGTYYFPGRQGKLWTTADWAAWTEIKLDSNSDIYNIVNAEGLTVVTGRNGNLFTSPNLTDWTNRKTGFDQNFSGIAHGSGMFVASDFDGNIIGSADGVSWSTVFTPGIDIGWQTVIFEDGKFVAMSSEGEWVLSPTGLSGQWSLPTIGFEGFPGINALRFLDGDWWVVGRDGFLRSSANLTNWDTHDIVTDNDLEDIFYNDGTFIAVGQGGEIYSSADGSTWTPRVSTTSNNLFHLTYGNGLFVAAGSSGTVVTSADGITWSGENQSNSPFNTQSLLFREGQFVAFDTSGRVALSSDGLSWTTVNTPVGGNLRGAAFSGTDIVVVGSDGLILNTDLPPPKTLTVNIVGEGNVNISPDVPNYPYLSQVTLTPEGTPDFAFQSWSGDASGNTNPLIVTMDEDKTITATFVLALSGYELWRFIEFTAEERADDEISGPDADPDEDGLTNNDEYLLGTNPQDKNGPHTLTVNILGEGTVEVSPAGGGPYTFMSEVTITATGTPEFVFSDWSGDASGSNNPLVVSMDGDKTINANFTSTLEGFALFRYTVFTAEERVDDDVAGPQADYDLDGLTNLEEYLLGTDPKVTDVGKGLRVGMVEIGGEQYLTITYSRSKDILGISQTVEVGSDFETWMSGPIYTEEYEVNDNPDGTEAVTMRILDPIGSLPSWFARLVLEE
ncbi:MAG: hypothetical protein ACI92G_003722, partial [Candidatus Pelagisphaera sp.]